MKVGVLGDSHGQEDALRTALRRMKAERVRHLLVLGDIVSWNLRSHNELERTLQMIQQESGLQRENIEILIGNAEEDVLGERIPIQAKFDAAGLTEESLEELIENKQIGRREAAAFYRKVPFDQTKGYALLQKYAVVKVKAPDEFSVVDLGGRKIALSHYNNRPLPEALLQDKDVKMKVVDPETGAEKTIVKNFRLPHTINAKRLSQPLPAGVDIAFYGDLHIGGAYWDAPMSTMIVNPGVLHAKAKDASEPQAFLIYSTRRNELTYYDAKTDKVIVSYDVNDFARKATAAPCHEHFFRLSQLLRN